MDIDGARSNRRGRSQANSAEARTPVKTPCAICTELGEHKKAKSHETSKCYKAHPKAPQPSGSGNGSGPNPKSGKGGDKGKDKAAYAAKKNTLKQIKARQLELEKELAEEEKDDISDSEMVIDSTRITDWHNEEKVQLQASELSTSKLEDEPIKKLKASKKAKYARLAVRKVNFLKDM